MADDDRAALEERIAADVRALTAQSDQIGHAFAARHSLSDNDFRALLHVLVAETTGEPLAAGGLRARMGVSGAAITYLVERMIASGHVLREPDPDDRRKVKLRVAEHGMDVAREFFTPLAHHLSSALVDVPDADLRAAHRVFGAIVEAMSGFHADLGVTSD